MTIFQRKFVKKYVLFQEFTVESKLWVMQIKEIFFTLVLY